MLLGFAVGCAALACGRAASKATRTDADVLRDYAALLRPTLPPTANDTWWEDFVAASRRPLRPSLRVTPRGGSLLERAARLGWQLDKVPWASSSFFAETDSVLGLDVGHALGHFYVQEAAAMAAVAALLDGETPVLVVDACAAPGGKTVQLCSDLAVAQPRACVIANDVSSSRIGALTHNVVRCGVSQHVGVTRGDAVDVLSRLAGACDAVLIDAPCSGDTQSRREGRSLAAHLRRASTPPDYLAAGQLRLLRAAFAALRPGGKLVYSTCALDPRENEHVVRDLLRAEPTASIDEPRVAQYWTRSPLLNGTFRLWPHHDDTAGFFVARIKREGNASAPVVPFPTKLLSQRCVDAALTRLRATWGVRGLPRHHRLARRRGRELWLVPNAAPDAVLDFSRLGAKLCESLDKKCDSDDELADALSADTLRWAHDFALANLSVPRGHPRCVALDDDALKLYLAGDDVPLATTDAAIIGFQVLVEFEGLPVGLAKALAPPARGGGGVLLKNQLPRNFVQRGVRGLLGSNLE